MAFSALIGALRVALRLDAAEYTEGLKQSKVELRKTARELNATAREMAQTGRTFSAGLTVPIVAGVAAAVKAGANFEASMIKVGISTKATASEMAALETSARQIGKATTFSASEAADAMDMLAKTGLGVSDILGGAAKAAVDLAAATGSQLEPASAAISDSMQQFKLTASQLPTVVNQITGAVNESKLSFEDFQAASGQAGGVAATLGVSFRDFNAVLAGTSSLFSSGSDAGTSFKTFLTTLTPKSNEAAAAIKAYGLSFFDANGNLKSMAAIAEELRTKLGGLSDEAKNQVLKDIFGTDAMRTAIGLMEQGAAGLENIQSKLDATDAAEQAAKRMEGFNGQLKQLGGSLQDLGISVAKTGLLTFTTSLIKGAADLVDGLNEANPSLIRTGLVFAGLAASVGPVTSGMGLFTAGLGRGAKAMSDLKTGATALQTGLAGLTAFVGPGGLLVLGLVAAAAAVVFLMKQYKEQNTASAEVTKQTDKLNVATETYAELARDAQNASGDARKAFLAEAAAKRELARQTQIATIAKLNDAKATLAQLQAATAQGISSGANAEAPASFASAQGARTDKASANIKALEASLAAAQKRIADADAVIKAIEAATNEKPKPDTPAVNYGGGGSSAGAGGGGRSASSVAADSEQAVAEAARNERDARMALTRNIAALAILREQEIAEETKQANNRLLQDVAEGQITRSAAELAIAKNNEAAAARTTLVRREAAAEADDQALRTADQLAAMDERRLGLEARMARNASDRADLEARALASEQASATARLTFELQQSVLAQERTQAEADLLLAKHREVQAAEVLAQFNQSQADIQAESADRARASLELQLELLQSQAAAAGTAFERVGLDEKILELQQQLERQKLEEVIASKSSTDLEVETARAKLRLLGTLQDNDRKARDGSVIDQFERTSGALQNVIDGADSSDWMQAFRGLDSAMGMFRKALAKGASAADKISAIAAIGSAAGSAIGGKAGGALSGAASGAAMGAQLGSVVPGIGTAVGAVAGGVLGAIGGIFGASKAKKRAKKEAAERARIEKERAAAELAEAGRQLDVQLLELQGKKLEAVAAQRKHELEQIDASLRARQEEIWAMEDAAVLAEQRTALERELLRLSDEAAADEADRIDALKALPEALQPLKQQIYDYMDALDRKKAAEDKWSDAVQQVADERAEAEQKVKDAAEAAISRLTDVASRMRGFAQELAGVRKELTTGALGGLDIRQQAAAAKREFNRLSTAAAAGDEAALAALPDAIRDFVRTQEATSTSKSALNQQIALARRAAAIGEAAAESAAVDADAQIAAIREQTGIQAELLGEAQELNTAMSGLVEAIRHQAEVQDSARLAIETLAASMPSALAAAVSGLQLSAPLIDARGFDIAAVQDAAVAAAQMSVQVNADYAPGQDIIDGIEPVLASVAVGLNRLDSRWDDLTHGGDTLRTTIVTP